jgi:hypothetical protein
MPFLGPTHSLPIRLLSKVQENTSRTMPTRVSSAPLTRRSLPKARCGSLFLAHPRQILTQSLQVDAARGRAAQLFYASALPFSSGCPPFSCLACLFAPSQHSHTPCRGPVSTLLTAQVPSWTPTTLFDRLLYFFTPIHYR